MVVIIKIGKPFGLYKKYLFPKLEKYFYFFTDKNSSNSRTGNFHRNFSRSIRDQIHESRLNEYPPFFISESIFMHHPKIYFKCDLQNCDISYSIFLLYFEICLKSENERFSNIHSKLYK